ncbi:response regulator transcription factor [Tumebacillus permanentifrigoris]|uniref:DNA-binding response OmpR family regulator n=1 Tax=Tumebacillus permanentifrigoris TaxID=378543 RepID=A0A316DB00_9BACL|nr:response regulator transcription factor [Tumebacillus permanentifrigoris]PWK14982.1 DNA-binding response OmpR family regulator [Tumebacillus permanentifrigoris]
MNVLLAEDDQRLGKLVLHLLTKKDGHQVDWVMRGDEAYDYAKAVAYDVIILDWMMPQMNGVEVCRLLRREGYTGAVLMLTAKDAVQDRVQGLDAGADDYLVKPFEFEELQARLRALGRRAFTPLQQDVFCHAGLEVNRTDHTVSRAGVQVQLSPREFQLLDLLLQNHGQVLPRELILQRVWGFDSDITKNAIDATVKLLRKKLDLPGAETLIKSVRGIGYKLEN